MATTKLSEGSLAIIMTGGTVDEPLMQVLGSKKIVGNAEKDRYRLLVSDGKYQISFAMIATQINEKVTSGDLSVNTVIKIKKFITSMISGGKGDRRVLVILDLEIVQRGSDVGGRIGNPVALPDDPSSVLQRPASSGSTSAASTSIRSTPAATSEMEVAPNKPKFHPKPDSTVQPMDANSSMGASQLTVPIENLSPYINKWVIKARVNNKSAIRTWNNSRGEGKLFSMDLADESGEIRATAFKEMVDKFYDMIEVDKVYYISKCQLKSANRQYCNLNNDYEMTLNSGSTITPCYDEILLPKATYNFITIDKITSEEPGAIIDVIAICKSVTDLQFITTKATNRELKKRELTLVDQSNTSIVLTLWGADAESFESQDSPVVSVRGAKVGEFGGGKNLSVLVSSTLKVNPEIPEAFVLKGWYENDGKTVNAVNISARTGAGSFPTEWMSIGTVKDRKLGQSATSEYYKVKGTILLANSANALYKACPTDNCKKKVVEMDNNRYRCEKCNREFDNFHYRLIMSMNIGDWSDGQWLSMFASEAEKVLGMTSQELGELSETDPEAIATVFDRVKFTEFVFKCRAKMESYNDETRLKSVAMNVEKINYKEYHSYLLTSISQALDI